MSNKVPIIKVKKELKRIDNANPYIKDVIALIGEFKTSAKSGEVFVAKGLAEAEAVLGNDVTVPANACLKQIFQNDNISGAIIVNQTPEGQGSPVSLSSALKVLEDIDFDLLYFVANATNTELETIASFADDRLEDKKPFCWITAFTRTSKSTYETSIGKVGDSCIVALTQGLTVKGDELSLLESGAYITNLIATSNVGDSLTAKVLEDVSGVDTTYNEDTTPKLSEMVGMGYFVVRGINPLEETFEVVNSANKDGIDMYITRVIAYVINEFALRDYLGKRNNISISGIKLEAARLLTLFRDDLKLIENMTYNVELKDSETAQVIINTIQFSGIITEIDVSITYEVV